MKLANDEQQVLNAVRYSPSVSLLVSFEPSLSLKTELEHLLKASSDEVKRELEKVYPEDVWKPVYSKLDAAIATLDYESARKSVAIYVSPIMAKVFYLDIPVHDKIIIDGTFEIRDLVYAKQYFSKAILLVLTSKRAKAFLAEDGRLIPLKLRHADNAEFHRDQSAPTSNFSDPSEIKEVQLDKFLRAVDQSLTEVLHAYGLPVFVMGAERVLGRFQRLSDHLARIEDMIKGNYDENTDAELLEVLNPYLDKMRADRRAELFSQMEQARNADHLETGVKAVWAASSRRLGKKLIVEKDYMFPADHAGNEEAIEEHDPTSPVAFFIKDAVDEIIRKVIESGGEVVFVDEMPAQYQHIALIRYY